MRAFSFMYTCVRRRKENLYKSKFFVFDISEDRPQSLFVSFVTSNESSSISLPLKHSPSISTSLSYSFFFSFVNKIVSYPPMFSCRTKPSGLRWPSSTSLPRANSHRTARSPITPNRSGASSRPGRNYRIPM